jgi:hypothetical protein
MAGDMVRGLDAPQLREVLRDILSGERRDLKFNSPPERHLEIAEVGRSVDAPRSVS